MNKNQLPPQVEFKEGPTVEVSGKPESTQLDTAVPETLATAPKKTGKGKKKEKVDVIRAMTGNITVRPFVDATKENMGLLNKKYILMMFS